MRSPYPRVVDTIRGREPRVCWVADRRAERAGVPWFSNELDTTTTQGAPLTRLRDRPRGDAEARSAPDACAADGLARAAGRSRATPSNASLAKVRADRKRLSPKLATRARKRAIGEILEARFTLGAFEEARRTDPPYWASLMAESTAARLPSL